MPLFAAYAETSEKEVNEIGETSGLKAIAASSEVKQQLTWLVNPSFNINTAGNEKAELSSDEAEKFVSEKEVDVGVEVLSQSRELRSETRRDRSRKKKDRSKSRSRSPKSRKKKKKKDKKKEEKIKRKDNVKREPLPLLNLPRSIVFSNNLGLRLEQSFHIDREKDKNNLAFNCMYNKNVAKYIPLNGVMGIDIPRQSHHKRKKPLRYFRRAVAKRLGEALGSDKSEESIRARVADFNEKLRTDPHNIQLWLEFLNYQEKALRLVDPESEHKESKTKTGSHRSLLERKIAIIEKAIESNPKSVELITTKLQLATEIWDFPALQQEWKKTLFTHPSSVTLWKSYLSFTEHYYEGFSVNHVLKSYANCIQKFIQMQKPSFSSHQRPKHLEQHLIDMLVQLGNFLRRSGLTEKSNALFQIIMELHFNRPKGYADETGDTKALISLLEPFWDCGAPRFGEENAKGWAMLLKTKEPALRKITGRDLSSKEDEIITSGKPRSEVWLQIESLRSQHHWLPWTAEPEIDEDCDDPERTVSVEDLSPFLFALKEDSALQFRLTVGFLTNLGIPLIPSSQTQRVWAPPCNVEDFFQYHVKFPEIFRLINSDVHVLEHESYYDFAAEVFRQSFEKISDPFKTELATWWLSFELRRLEIMKKTVSNRDFKDQWATVKKNAKNLLKLIPGLNSTMNYLLYAAYARLEHVAGNTDDSVKILDKILQMAGENPLNNPGPQSSALLHLWRSKLEILISNRKFDAATNYLINLGSKLPFDPKFQPTAAVQLKSKRNFDTLKSNLNYSMEKINEGIGLFSQVDFVVDFLVCYSYYVALTEGITPAVAFFKNWIKVNEKNLELNESLKFDAEVLEYHYRRESLYLAMLRLITKSREFSRDLQLDLFSRTLEEALQNYPGNCEILMSFVESEERCSIVSRLWRNLERLSASDKTESVVVAYANCLALAAREESVKRSELVTWKELNQTHEIAVFHKAFRNKLRHYSENCVSKLPGRNSPVLWRISLKAAYVCGNLNKCKALFYRAIRECPSSKALYMDIVQYIPSMVKEVTQLMLEKELRLRFPLEELDVLLEPEPEAMEEVFAGEVDQILEGHDVSSDETSSEEEYSEGFGDSE